MTDGLKTALIGAVAAIAVAMSGLASAQEFTLEGKIVTWIVGFREGSETDRLTRILQSKMSDNLPGNPNVIVLNRPGGESVTASNDFHANATADGTTLITSSTSGLIPVLLRSKRANYDPNEWVAIAGFARGATLYALSDQIGLGGTDRTADYEALRSANIRFGAEIPHSADLLDIVSMELLGGIKPHYLFGLSSKDTKAAFQRGEMNVSTDNTRSYLKNHGDDPEINPVWSYGIIGENGELKRDPDLPNIPTFREFYEAAKGESPSGPASEAHRSLMNAKVMLSKSIMLPRDTPHHIRQAYIDALRAVTSDPEVAAKLSREVGSMPLNFGDDTQVALAQATSMAPGVREWVRTFLKERFNTDLD